MMNAKGHRASWFVWLLILVALASTGCAGMAAKAEVRDASSPAEPQFAPAEPAAEETVLGQDGSPPAPPAALGVSGLITTGTSGVPHQAEAVELTPSSPSTPSPAPEHTAERHPLLIYTASLVMAVFEAAKAIDEVEGLAKRQGGYLVRRTDNEITIRVPAGNFDSSLDFLKTLGDELHRVVNVRDVTAEFNDLSLQLRNLEVMRERFEELLKRANSVKDALAVESELQRVLADIERLKGRLKLLGELIAYSTITIRFESRPADRVRSRVELPFPWLQQLGLPELLDL